MHARHDDAATLDRLAKDQLRRDALPLARSEFLRVNHDSFGGKLPPTPIRFDDLPTGIKALCSSRSWSHADPYVITIGRGFHDLADLVESVRHEAVHLFEFATYNHSDHGAGFHRALEAVRAGRPWNESTRTVAAPATRAHPTTGRLRVIKRGKITDRNRPAADQEYVAVPGRTVAAGHWATIHAPSFFAPVAAA